MTDESETAALTRMIRRRFYKGLFLSLVIFISGAACGWGARMLLPPSRPPGPGMAFDPPVDQIVARMKEELRLSDEQTSQLDEVYKKRFDAIKKVRDSMLPSFQKEYDELRDEVQKILTPEQFKQWSVRYENVRGHTGMGPPPHGPPPGQPGDRGNFDNHGPGEFPPDGDRGPREDHRPMRPGTRPGD